MNKNDNNIGASNSTTSSQSKNKSSNKKSKKPKPTTKEKIEYVKIRLKNNFPSKVTFVVGLLHVLIGLAAIAIQIFLITNVAINYTLGGGIWGGFFAVVSGLIKLNLCKLMSFFMFFIE